MRELPRPLDDQDAFIQPEETRIADWRPTLTKRKGVTKHKLLTERIIADIDADILPAHARTITPGLSTRQKSGGTGTG